MGIFCTFLFLNINNLKRNVEIPRNEGSRYNKGRAFVEYSSTQEAKNVFIITFVSSILWRPLKRDNLLERINFM